MNTYMKKSGIFILLVTLLVACKAPDKKAELDKLRKEKSEIETKIAALEAELAKTDTTSEERALEVSVTDATPETFRTYVEILGKVDADESVSLSSEIPGTVVRINVKAGDRVTKGQVLAETDSRAAQQQLVAMQTNLSLLTQLYEKQKNLWEQKIGSEVQYLQSKTQKESMEANISALQEQIRMSKIISPIDGTVDGVNIKIGQAIAPGVPAINVINFNTLKIKADVAEHYMSKVKGGNEVLVYFPDVNDSAVTKLTHVSRAINAVTRTFGVEAGLDNTKEYHPNMVARLRINDYTSEKPELVIPVKYIQKGTTESYVMVVEKDRAVKHSILISREYNGLALIASGIQAGDQIITEGYDLVNDGDKVIVKK